ncbi:MAG: YggS family pyridoxal phosphate-dependent enzyme [Deltaproteobacteria bacterium]|nr:YggS family pyridoxal phosphate-dependent enzyme [Deltaproteobacteria bacterium]
MASPPDSFEHVARGLDAVRERIARAARAAGRAPDAVRLIAVSKTMPGAAIRAAHAAGQRDFGENYAQELAGKLTELGDLPDLAWHFIGNLQRNKAKLVVGRACIHTLDGTALADELERRAAAAGIARVDTLIEVNVGGEAQKSGVAPADLPTLLDALAGRPHLRVGGLMCIPPAATDPEASRPHFRALARLRDELSRTPRAGIDLGHLSMGMSVDLEAAIAEGATLVRVGTAIFGERRPRH